MFTQDFPKPALSTLMGLLNKDKPDPAHIALALYDLAGYGLGMYFGDVKYPMSLDLGKLLVVASSPEFAAAQPAIQAFYKYVQEDGLPRWRALLKILVEYGPAILKLVLMILAVV